MSGADAGTKRAGEEKKQKTMGYMCDKVFRRFRLDSNEP